MAKKIILFDLGQTLVDYFTRAAFPPLVEKAIAAAAQIVRDAGLPIPPDDVMRRRFAEENREAQDGCVRPLEDRLARLFDLHKTPPGACHAFTAVLIAPGRLYDDTLPTLDELRRRGHRLGIVSNMPWGTPAEPWAEDLRQRGIAPYMEHILFCRDVGWRKPDRRIFEEALRRFGCASEDCLFVGDRPDWDIRGALDAGIDAVLLDRGGDHPDHSPRITSLRELPNLL